MFPWHLHNISSASDLRVSPSGRRPRNGHDLGPYAHRTACETVPILGLQGYTEALASMQARSHQGELLAEVVQGCTELALSLASRPGAKCTRAEIDEVLERKWAVKQDVPIEIMGIHHYYRDGVCKDANKRVRQSVWRAFLRCCASLPARPQPLTRISFEELLGRIHGMLEGNDAHIFTECQGDLQQFWEALCLLADYVELDGKSDMIAVSTALGHVKISGAPQLPEEYQPSGRLGLVDATLKVMYHYAAGQPYPARENAHSRNHVKHRSMVAALCTPGQIHIMPGPSTAHHLHSLAAGMEMPLAADPGVGSDEKFDDSFTQWGDLL